MKITSKPLAALIFVMIFGGIGLTMAMNVWQDGSSKVPRIIAEGEGAGQYDPADLRGSNTFEDVSKYFNVPAETLQKAFRIPADRALANTLLKEMADFAPEMAPHSVGMFAAFYNGRPYVPSEEAYLSTGAAQILIQHGKMTPEQRAYLDAHTIEDAGTLSVQEPAQESPAVTPPEKAKKTIGDKTVTGSTTFQDLLDWGLPKETIETMIGGKFDKPNITVRDHFSNQGLEFKPYKDKLQAELDKIQ